MTHDAMVTLCEQWERAFSSRDLHTLADLYSPDAVVESPMAGTVSGRDAIAEAHNSLFAAFPDMTSTFEPALVDGHRAAVVAEAGGAQTGAVLGLPASGRSFRFRLVFLLEIRDGLIVRDRRIYDFTGLLVQVGVLKAKPV